MAKLRVYELAKELSMESREVIRRLNNMGLDLKNHMSTVDDKYANQLREMVKPGPNRVAERIQVKKPDKTGPGKSSVSKGMQNRETGKKTQSSSGPVKKERTDLSRKPTGEKSQKSEKPRQRTFDKEQQKSPEKYPEKSSEKRQENPKQKTQQQKGATGVADKNRDSREASSGPKYGEKERNDVNNNAKVNSGKARPKSNRPKENNFKGGSKKRGGWKGQKKAHSVKQEIQPVTPKKVIIGESVILAELAKGMGKTATEVIKKLMQLGIMATINQELDSDTAVLVAEEFGIPVEVRLDKIMEIIEDQDDSEETLLDRPPVVTVMGHVDHGKTSLLDAIRQTDVIATEAGGITQHIGAYQVEVGNKKITFLDTPGHEAFTAMRARGAQVTDIAILVVAADDGVMPQTVEAINHAKAAKVPIIVAINKIDKPAANPDRVKQELTEYGLVAEEWGGDTIMVPVSAKTKEGISSLLEMILLVAEVAELKANPDRMSRGTVVEAQLDKSRGPVATILVQKGTLKIGDNLVAGTTFGKVRAMLDDKGRRIKLAGPSTPVQVLGFSVVPPAGEIFTGVEIEKDARHIAGQFQIKKREEEMGRTVRVSLDDLFKQISEGEVKELNVVVKADVQGSVEAICQSLTKLSTGEVRVNIIHAGVGTVTESDVMLAAASNAIIIGFNVRPDANTRKAAEVEKIDLRLYRVIYDAIDDVKAAMAGLLDPTYKEVVIGRLEVRATFKVPKVGMIAGSYVLEGKITRQSEVRVIRDGIVVKEGHLESLKRFKDDVKEVVAGYECGVGIESFNDIEVGDIIEAFVMEEAKREL